SSILKSFAKNHLGMCLEVGVEYMTYMKDISISIRDMNTNTPENFQVRGRRSPYKLIFHKLLGDEAVSCQGRKVFGSWRRSCFTAFPYLGQDNFILTFGKLVHFLPDTLHFLFITLLRVNSFSLIHFRSQCIERKLFSIIVESLKF